MAMSVIALCDIPKGVTSQPGVGPIDLRRLFDNTLRKIMLHVDMNKNYLSIVQLQTDEEWARFIPIAKNCHEQNVEITSTSRGLVLRTIRQIKAHEELFVWIGYDLLSKLDFPFLNPSNIRDYQAYICHKCLKVFENPNPLKVHLSFLCQKQETFSEEPSVKKMWINNLHLFPSDMTKSIADKVNLPILCNKSLLFKEDITLAVPVCGNRSFQKDNNKAVSYRTSMGTENTVLDLTKTCQILHQPNLVPSVSYNWKSVENCSQTAQGHICAFCGKVYSRKYGLKIHVRTHTGHKPLKCKYCFRPFSDPSNLNKHVRLHSESDAPYRCMKCGKVLVRRRDLERHLKSRHPEAPSLDSRTS